jgi:hypothetical protein
VKVHTLGAKYSLQLCYITHQATVTPSVHASALQQNQAHKSKLSEEMVHKQKFKLRNFTASAVTLFYKVIQLRQDNVSLITTTVCKQSAVSLYWEMFTDHSSSTTERNCTVVHFRQS